jgi:hypothetical protein
MKKHFRISFAIALCVFFNGVHAQDKNSAPSEIKENPIKKFIVKYGFASFYATKFHGRKTANGETYRNELLTAACNILPLNTWIKVTNLLNNHPLRRWVGSIGHSPLYVSDGGENKSKFRVWLSSFLSSPS